MSKDYFGPIEEDAVEVYVRSPDYTGQRYCKWLVVQRVKGPRYLCRCDCGFEAVKDISHLKGLRSMQCKKCYMNSASYFMRKRESL